jgi:hypothetical protein
MQQEYGPTLVLREKPEGPLWKSSKEIKVEIKSGSSDGELSSGVDSFLYVD